MKIALNVSKSMDGGSYVFSAARNVDTRNLGKLHCYSEVSNTFSTLSVQHEFFRSIPKGREIEREVDAGHMVTISVGEDAAVLLMS